MANKQNGNLTSKNYWDATYTDRGACELSVDGFRNRYEAKIFNVLRDEVSNAKNVLEIGAGDSLWLPFLANRFKSVSFTGLDYSELGCEKLGQRGMSLGINVICEDFLQPRSEMAQRYDLLLSFGVVEHFESLKHVLANFRNYLIENGRVVTIIPNMSGSLGWLTKHLNREVFLLHNPHTLESLISGHKDAGFKIIAADYLGTTNFGVLSSCVKGNGDFNYYIYLWLSRLTKAISLFEAHTVDFSTSKFLSPYIYCIAEMENIS